MAREGKHDSREAIKGLVFDSTLLYCAMYFIVSITNSTTCSENRTDTPMEVVMVVQVEVTDRVLDLMDLEVEAEEVTGLRMAMVQEEVLEEEVTEEGMSQSQHPDLLLSRRTSVIL